MANRHILFSPPDIGYIEIEEVIDTLRSGWITTGPKTKKFENEIKEFCNADNCVCLNSQTACQEMALRLLGIGEGDEVIVPAYTYTASASVVCHLGATLKLCDIQNNSLEMDYNALSDLITEKTKAIIPVDLAGIPCDYEKIYSVVENKSALFKPSNKIQEAIGRIAVCADCAHSFGAVYKNNPIGNVADFSSFSFHAVKNLTTGEGGALTWKNIKGIDEKEIYHLAQLYSLHGQSKDAFSKNKLGAWEYDIEGPWYKCNMTDIMAALGIGQLKRYKDMLKKRKEMIEFYDSKLNAAGIKSLNHYSDDIISSGHLYISNIPNIDIDKRNLIICKMAEKEIPCNVHYKPLPMMTAYKELGFDIKDFPNAYHRFENEITLPLHTKLETEDLEYIADNYINILKNI